MAIRITWWSLNFWIRDWKKKLFIFKQSEFVQSSVLLYFWNTIILLWTAKPTFTTSTAPHCHYENYLLKATTYKLVFLKIICLHATNFEIKLETLNNNNNVQLRPAESFCYEYFPFLFAAAEKSPILSALKKKKLFLQEVANALCTVIRRTLAYWFRNKRNVRVVCATLSKNLLIKYADNTENYKQNKN